MKTLDTHGLVLRAYLPKQLFKILKSILEVLPICVPSAFEGGTYLPPSLQAAQLCHKYFPVMLNINLYRHNSKERKYCLKDDLIITRLWQVAKFIVTELKFLALFSHENDPGILCFCCEV